MQAQSQILSINNFDFILYINYVLFQINQNIGLHFL